MARRESRGRLTAREMEVVQLAAQGLTDKAIAKQLGIGEGTVNTHWTRIRDKTGGENRTELVTKILAAEAEEANAALRVQISRLTNELARLTTTHGSIGNEESYRELVLLLPQPVVVCDEDFKVVIANYKTHEILRYTPFEIVGMSVDLLIPARERGERVRVLQGLFDACPPPPYRTLS